MFRLARARRSSWAICTRAPPRSARRPRASQRIRVVDQVLAMRAELMPLDLEEAARPIPARTTSEVLAVADRLEALAIERDDLSGLYHPTVRSCGRVCDHGPVARRAGRSRAGVWELIDPQEDPRTVVLEAGPVSAAHWSGARSLRPWRWSASRRLLDVGVSPATGGTPEVHGAAAGDAGRFRRGAVSRSSVGIQDYLQERRLTDGEAPGRRPQAGGWIEDLAG